MARFSRKSSGANENVSVVCNIIIHGEVLIVGPFFIGKIRGAGVNERDYIRVRVWDAMVVMIVFV